MKARTQFTQVTVGELVSFILETPGVVNVVVTDRNGKVQKVEHRDGVSRSLSSHAFENKHIKVLASTGIKFDESQNKLNLFDFDYRAILVKSQLEYYISITFQPHTVASTSRVSKANVASVYAIALGIVFVILPLFMLVEIHGARLMHDFDIIRKKIEQGFNNNLNSISTDSIDAQGVVGSYNAFCELYENIKIMNNQK